MPRLFKLLQQGSLYAWNHEGIESSSESNNSVSAGTPNELSVLNDLDHVDTVNDLIGNQMLLMHLNIASAIGVYIETNDHTDLLSQML